MILWEIFTFGKIPYAALSASEVLRDVVNGLRLEKPDAASDSVYTLMRRCWEQEPAKRGTFAQIYLDVSLLVRGARDDPT